MVIKVGKFYVLDVIKLQRDAPWTHDWGINRDCIVYVEEVLPATNEAIVHFDNQQSGNVPQSVLRNFVKPDEFTTVYPS